MLEPWLRLIKGCDVLAKNREREVLKRRRKKECKKRILRIHCKERPKKESEVVDFPKKRKQREKNSDGAKGGEVNVNVWS